MAKEKDPNEIKVNDRRLFTMEGELRDGVPTDTPEQEAPKPEASHDHERPALELVKDGKPEPQDSGAGDEPKLGPVPVPDAEEQMKSDAKKAFDGDASASQSFGGQEPTFLHLLELLVQSAMMYAGAMETGAERHIDVVGLRQIIDLIGVLEEKTRGNLTEHEAQTISSTLFQLRMSYMEIIQAIQKQATVPDNGGNPKA